MISVTGEAISYQLSAGWSIDLHFVQIGDHTSDTEVDVVITTDENDIATETGTRHTFRDNLDSNSYALQVEGKFGGGSDLNGSFNMTADGGTTTDNTEDITMTDGEITHRAVTEILTTGNGYHFSMTAKGNGFSFSTTAGGGSGLEQRKRGNLDYEVVEGVRTDYSNYSNRFTLDGLYESRSSGGEHEETRYRMTRYFDENGDTSDFLINQFNRSDHTTNSSYDGATGQTTNYEADNETHAINQIGPVGEQQEVAGPGTQVRVTGNVYHTTTDSQGNVSVDSDLTGETQVDSWDTNLADTFAEFVPSLPFFDPMAVASSMMDYVGGGGWDMGGLGFGDNGSGQTAPEPTGEPVSSGTKEDGTYWEHFDNGDFWLYREYESEGGELIKEDWGYYSQTFFDILQGFNQLIEEAMESTGLDQIDEFFSDLTEVGESLSQEYNVPVKAEEEIDDISDLQEEHLPNPAIYATRRPIGIYNAEDPWYNVIHAENNRAENIRKSMIDIYVHVQFTVVNGLKKKIAELEANRINTIPVGFGETTIETKDPKTPEQIKLEKELAIAEAEAQRFRDILHIGVPRESLGPYAEMELPDKFAILIEKAWQEGYFGDKLSEDIKALQDPQTIIALAEALAVFGGAYAAAHYFPGTYIADAIIITATAGEAGQVLADIYEAYLEVQGITHESDLEPAAKKLAELIVEASESGVLSIVFHLGGKAIPKGKNTEVPPVKRTHDLQNQIINHDTCFVAGTPVLTPDGEQNIETFKPGDQILSRPENAPEYPVKVSIVEEVFELAAWIMELRVDGQVIGTTEEHPFFVVGKGWVPAGELVACDQLLGHDDHLATVESVTKSGRYETVYNMRVKQDRTYFVGKQSWGFSIWVHNTYKVEKDNNGLWKIVDENGTTIRDGLSIEKATSQAEVFNKAPELGKGPTDVSSPPTKVGYMSEYFNTEVGATLKEASKKTNQRKQGQSVYKATDDIGDYIRDGDQFYLDNQHKNHIEVFDSRGKFRAVINLDGTLNTERAKGRRI
ncbi:hypothetical protein CA11_29230 [Gimesia maris]|nr:hypothetical protein CA11_29230 [Gimesia maris]